jgi:hypothetical protein
MPKIRDDINLKELEKYGYKLQEDWWNRTTEVIGNDVKGEMIYSKNVDSYVTIEIELETRRITENYDDMFVTVDEKYIKDLIKADLVEKKGD